MHTHTQSSRHWRTDFDGSDRLALSDDIRLPTVALRTSRAARATTTNGDPPRSRTNTSNLYDQSARFRSGTGCLSSLFFCSMPNSRVSESLLCFDEGSWYKWRVGQARNSSSIFRTVFVNTLKVKLASFPKHLKLCTNRLFFINNELSVPHRTHCFSTGKISRLTWYWETFAAYA